MRNVLPKFILSVKLAVCPFVALAQTPPAITTQPASQTAGCHSNVTFTVTATGAEPLAYYWRANGQFIGPTITTNASLFLPNILYEDGTKFSVVVSNAFGMVASEPAVLTVTNSPVPTLSIIETIGGVSPLLVSWPFSCTPFTLRSTTTLGSTVDSASTNWFIPFILQSTTNLTNITNFPVLAANEYTNYLYATTNGSSFYTLHDIFPGITSQPVSTNLAVGSAVTFSVAATNPPCKLPLTLSYQWRLNGIALTNQSPQTNALTITNVQRSNAGSYDVVVFNTLDAVRSEIATLKVTGVEFALTNNFTDRITTTSVSNAINGSNIGATKEPFEPNHAGILGGKSVWLAWQAPENGIATFDTIGSAFDTVLAVYTGTNVAALTLVTSDDDSGGFYTSQVQFNAVAGTAYQIAIDGFGGDSGNISLNWKLEVTSDQIPQIKTQPQSQTALTNSTATFTVVVDSGTLPLTYQWKFNGTNIGGPTTTNLLSNSLLIQNPQLSNMGRYTVVVSNTNRSVESVVAYLDLELERTGDNLFLPFSSERHFKDKLEVRFDPSPNGPNLLNLGRPKPRPKPQILSVSFGWVQIATAGSGATQGWDWGVCNYPMTGTLYVDVVPTADGNLYLDTFGSSADTLLSVLLPSGATYCNDNVAGTVFSQVAVSGVRANWHYPVTLGVKQGIRRAHLC